MDSISNVSVSVVPWRNAAEFRKVYEYLFSDELKKKKWAVDTISVWETRCHPSLPTAIEASYVLAGAVVQDTLWNNMLSLNEHCDLQAIYGHAITRFVSLSVEVHKDKGCASYSTSEVAKSIGIEPFIVDVRNEVCHSSRPSLSVLRLAAQSALKYLKESYWDKEAPRMTDFVRQPQDANELSHLFKQLIEAHRKEYKSGKVKNADGSKPKKSDYHNLVQELKSRLEKDKRFFIKILATEDIFIPTDEDLKRLLPEDDFEILQKAHPEKTVVPNDKFRDDFLTIPRYHEDLWFPIILILNQADSVPLFMESLLRTQGKRTDIGQKLLIYWIWEILNIHNQKRAQKSSRLKKLFQYRGIVPNWLRMFYAAVSNPCKYMFYILPQILVNVNIDKNIVDKISGLAAIKLGLIPKPQHRSEISHRKFYSVEDLKNEFKRLSKKEKQQVEELPTENIWSPCPDVCYKSWPIGHIVNSVRDDEMQEEKDVEMCEALNHADKQQDDYFCRRIMLPGNRDDDDEEEEEEEETQKEDEMEVLVGNLLEELQARKNRVRHETLEDD